MLSTRSFDEIQVFEGIAERIATGVEWSAVRRSRNRCRSFQELIRKARVSGDGIFYLPLNVWPHDLKSTDVRRPWVVLSDLAAVGP